MNCKPGELARVIDDPDTRFCGMVDNIIRVIEAYRHNGIVMWSYEGPLVKTALGKVVGIADELLRPINGGESPEESTEAMRKLHELPQEVTT